MIFFRKQWMGVGESGSHPEKFWFRRNAHIYVSEMNEWSKDYFDNERFWVRAI